MAASTSARRSRRPTAGGDWAADRQGITGDELLAFINNDGATRPNGTRDPGLFAYLRALTNANGDDRRDVIATVFRGVDNRMRSGYLMRRSRTAIVQSSQGELHIVDDDVAGRVRDQGERTVLQP